MRSRAPIKDRVERRYSNALITYCCAAPAHWDHRPSDPLNVVTIHERKWAYCPSGQQVTGEHVWLESPPTPLGTFEALRTPPDRKVASR